MAKLIGRLIAAREELDAQLNQEQEVVEYPVGTSLNAGAELDDEFPPSGIVEEPLEAGILPDLQNSGSELVALECRIKDLLYLAEDIEKTHGMTRDFALEAEKLLPGFGNGTPTGYYTLAPSATRYKVSLEEITKGVWALIAATAAAVIAMIVKAFRWFSGKGGKDDAGSASSGGGEVKVEEAVKAVEQTAEAVKETVTQLEETQTVVDNANDILNNAELKIKNEVGHEKVCRSFQELMDHLFVSDGHRNLQKYIQYTEPVLNDIIKNGSYSKMITNVGDNLKTINRALGAKVAVIDKAVRESMNARGEVKSDMEVSRQLGITKNKIEIHLNGKTMSLKEAVHAIRDEESMIKEEGNASDPVRFDQVFTTMANAYRHRSVDRLLMELSDTLKEIDRIRAALAKVEDAKGDYRTAGSPGSVSQEHHLSISSAITATGVEIQSAIELGVEIRKYAEQLKRIAESTTDVAVMIVKKTSDALRSEKKEIPPGWTTVLSDLSKRKQLIQRAFYGR